MFKLEFDTINAAFGDAPDTEVARLLREVAGKVEARHTEGVLRDVNGNRIGSWSND